MTMQATSQPQEHSSIKLAGQISDVAVLLLLGLGVALLHILANGQYGFHRDELDIIMNARQLDWGYVAYPPVTPSIARIGLTLFGESLRGLRVISAISQGIVVVLVGLMARDFGGKRPAQLLAALAVAVAPAALTAGTLIQYMAFDYLLWVLLAFFVVRVLATDDPRWWLGVGAAAGLGMMTKYTILFFIAGLVVAVLLTRTRKALRSPWLWGGVALALLIYLPNLIWQIQHDFISLDFLGAIHARDIDWGRADSYLSDQLYITSNPFMLPLWIAGLVWCLILPAGRRFRALGWMFLVTFALLFLSQWARLLHRAGLCRVHRGRRGLVGKLADRSHATHPPRRLGIFLGIADRGSPAWRGSGQTDRADKLAAVGDYVGRQRRGA